MTLVITIGSKCYANKPHHFYSANTEVLPIWILKYTFLSLQFSGPPPKKRLNSDSFNNSSIDILKACLPLNWLQEVSKSSSGGAQYVFAA